MCMHGGKTFANARRQHLQTERPSEKAALMSLCSWASSLWTVIKYITILLYDILSWQPEQTKHIAFHVLMLMPKLLNMAKKAVLSWHSPLSPVSAGATILFLSALQKLYMSPACAFCPFPLDRLAICLMSVSSVSVQTSWEEESHLFLPPLYPLPSVYLHALAWSCYSDMCRINKWMGPI